MLTFVANTKLPSIHTFGTNFVLFDVVEIICFLIVGLAFITKTALPVRTVTLWLVQNIKPLVVKYLSRIQRLFVHADAYTVGRSVGRFQGGGTGTAAVSERFVFEKLVA